MTETYTIRQASLEDAPQLLSIYAPYVLKTVITFETEVPSPAEFTSRIGTVLKKYPYLVAEHEGILLGYAYASAFKERAAYDWSVETSIYVDWNTRHAGVGRLLYEALEKNLKKQNICNLCACISYPHPESVSFHEKCGYQTVAHFHHSGYKFGAWHDMIWMEKTITPHENPPMPFIPYPLTLHP